jgi:hypothetical protein
MLNTNKKIRWSDRGQHIGAVLFCGIGIRSCSSGASKRIALAILAVQSAGFALFYFLQKSQKKTKVSFLSFRYLY